MAGLAVTTGAGSEFGRLKTVLLYVPGRELAAIEDPSAVLHLAPIDAAALGRELRALAAAYRRLGVRVRRIAARPDAPPNLMYVRDLFFATPKGAIVSRMASPVRNGEPALAARALKKARVPVLKTISGAGRFEGADALWLDPRTVVCGVGNRTNAEGFRQLRAALQAQGVEAIGVKAPRGVLHLLGALQIVDAELALVRARIAGRELVALLKRREFQVLAVPETAQVKDRQGFNVVAIAPRTIVMPKGCPGLKRLYRAAGLRIAAEVEASQLARGAGGLACATGIVARQA